MDRNNPLPPVWQFSTTGSGHTSRMVNSTSNTRKLNAGNNISSVKYVTNARANMKIINIPSQQPTVTTTNDGTLLYGAPVGGSFLTVTNEQQQQQQVQPQVHRSTTMTTSNHAALMSESVLVQTPDGQEYLVDERSIQNIDQIPPENLIYMTASEELSVVNAEHDNQLSIIEGNPLELHDYVDTTVQPIESMDQTHTNTVEQYSEECEVTEEVITDDWVQPQGEDCVQVTVDQLGVSMVVVEEDDIPVPLDQDQYTLSRPYPCDFCSRRFRKKSSLQNHLMAHSNDRPHCCNLCGAQYGHRSDLINHLKQHAYFVNDQDEMSLRSDQEAEYDLPDLPNTSAAHSIKQRARRLSEDEDMYIQNSVVSYNSQPPMQLISTTNYGAGSSTATSSATLYGQQQQDDTVGHASYIDGGGTAMLEQKYVISNGQATPVTTLSSTGANGKRTPRKKASTNTARTRPAVSSKTTSQRSGNGTAGSNRQIKKEPHDNGGSDITSNDWRKPYVCQQCGSSFARAKTLQSHMRTHASSSSTRYECVYCNMHFWEESLLQDHIQRAHFPEQQNQSNNVESWTTARHDPYASGSVELPLVDATKQYNCDGCSIVFFQQEHLLKHRQHAHHELVVKQELIHNSTALGRESEREAEVSTDQEMAEEDEEEVEEAYEGLDYAIENYDSRAKETDLERTLLTCRDCGDTFETAMDLLEHSEMHSGRCEPLECQLCGEKFLDESAIKQHVQDRHRHELTETSCVNCGKRCKSQTTLMKHAWDHSRERVHSCSKCGKTFHHMTRLKRHMDSHRNKAVRCEVCKEEFPDGRTLMNHRHSHTKANEYPCHECGKTFGSRSSQQIHMRIHTGERPYACRFCWKAFADGGTLRKHERIHTGEKPYACPVCPKAFNQRVVLREHIRAHHSQADAKHGSPDQQPYYCPVCSSPFPSTADLVQHLIEHSDTNTAMKRKPPSFPRKYKRRRKLKPHELERLQSARRKQKPKRKNQHDDEEEEEEEGDDDGGDRLDGSNTASETHGDDGKPIIGSTVVRSHPDGTLKTNRELFLEYGGCGGRVSRAPKSSASVSSSQGGMLDDNGINLLSNVVLLHGQQEETAKLHNNNHLPESPEQLPPGEMVVKSKQTAGSSRMSYAQKTKTIPAKKTPAARKRAAKEQPAAAAPAPPAMKLEDEEDPTMAKAMEAFFRDRKRNASLLPEIPPHRISSVGFPLLDDGNTDDPMDEPEQQSSRRSATISFSASEDDLNQQLLMEISHKNKYTDRFNSDTVNDLEEILRSPMKGASRTTTTHQVPSSATAKKKATSSQRKAKAKPKAKGKPGSSSKQQKPVEKKIAPERPAVLRSQRLTRRQLELEVNFLKEAFETDPVVHGAAESLDTANASLPPGKTPIKQETNDKQSPGDGVPVDTTERLDGSEQLAAMLLNDGLPHETGGNSSSGESSRRSSSGVVSQRQEEKAFATESAYAEGLHMMETGSIIKQEDDDNDELDEMYLHDAGTTSATGAAAGNESMYRCSICAACFDDRAQLILHVPVHI